jgi:hypothetical protein
MYFFLLQKFYDNVIDNFIKDKLSYNDYLKIEKEIENKRYLFTIHLN